jgi:signal peptidase I
VELLLPGGGYALSGQLRWGAASVAAMVAMLVACLVTPWAVLGLAAVRLLAALDAGRRGRAGPPVEGWRWQPMLLFGAVGLGASMLVRLQALEAFTIPSTSMAPTLQLDDKIMVDKLSMHWHHPERGEVIAFAMGGRTFVKRVIAVGGDEVAVHDGVPVVNGTVAVRRALGPASYEERDEVSGRMHREAAFGFEERHAGHTYRVFRLAPAGEPSGPPDFPDVVRGCDRVDPAFANHPARNTRALEPGAGATCRVPAGTVFVMGDNRDNSADSRAWGAVPVGDVFGRVVGVWLGGPGQRLGRIGAVD